MPELSHSRGLQTIGSHQDDEERGACPDPGQGIQNKGSPVGIGPVVEGEGHGDQ